MNELRMILEFQWAVGFSPFIVKGFFISFFVLVGLFSLWQKREFIYQGAPSQALWRDLRIWAIGILILQAWIYLLF